MFVIIQGVYSQSGPPVDPAWATQTLKCGFFPWAHFEYSSSHMSDQDKFACGYWFFRDWLTIVYWVALAYVSVIFAVGGMQKYWRYMKASVNVIIWIFTGCGSCCTSDPKADKKNDAFWIQFVIFFILAGVLIGVSPEFAFLYHLVIDMYYLGDINPSNRESFCPCGPDLENGKDVKVPTSSVQESAPLVANGTVQTSSMFNDPFNLRPRIQFVTKYKPVPNGQLNP